MNPAANSVEAFQAALASYKQQHDQATQQLSQVEQTYQKQKGELSSLLLMLAGAGAALEQLVKNVADEKKALEANISKAVEDNGDTFSR